MESRNYNDFVQEEVGRNCELALVEKDRNSALVEVGRNCFGSDLEKKQADFGALAL